MLEIRETHDELPEEDGMDTDGTTLGASLLMCLGVVLTLLLVWGLIAWLAA
jgi:hypothetical protein